MLKVEVSFSSSYQNLKPCLNHRYEKKQQRWRKGDEHSSKRNKGHWVFVFRFAQIRNEWDVPYAYHSLEDSFLSPKFEWNVISSCSTSKMSENGTRHGSFFILKWKEKLVWKNRFVSWIERLNPDWSFPRKISTF